MFLQEKPKLSIVFDRAVDFYDRSRGLPPDIADLPVEALVRETHLRRDSSVLEIGIGTGRIAIALASDLKRLTGIDLSMAMMQLLQSKIGRTGTCIDLAKADAVSLPFPSGRFDLVYAVHVLHLVKGWQAAVAEAKRVLKRGGFFGVSWHRRVPDSPNVLLRQELHRLVEEEGVNTKRPGAQSEDEISRELEAWGNEVRLINVAEWTEPITPAQIIDELDRQLYSETWMIPRAVLDQVIPRLTEWAKLKFGSLDREIQTPYSFRWLVARKN